LITPNAGADSINSNGWNSSTLDLSDYYSFGVTPSAGFTLNLSSLSYVERRSGTGPTSFAIRSSVDGFTTNLFSYSLLAANTSDTTKNFSLAGVSSLQNLTSGVTLRLYGFGASSAAGTYRLTSPNTGTGLVLGGTLSATASAAPEPGSLALAAFGLLPLAAVVAKRRRSNR
jgi:hypothetical protein